MTASSFIFLLMILILSSCSQTILVQVEGQIVNYLPHNDYSFSI
jgi:hypothetical protein